jgi:hypothetical protein
MTCGCAGGGKLPAKLTLRIEAVRLSQDPQSRLDANAVFSFLTDGVDLSALDAPLAPVAVGDSAAAVTSRNALLVQPLVRIAGFNRSHHELFQANRITNLGALAQFDPPGRDPLWEQVNIDLGRYGLSLAMTTEQMRDWVLKGP